MASRLSPRAADFLDELDEVSAAAAHAAGGFDEMFYGLGESAIRLQLAGSALIPPLTRALAHLRMAPVADPALTIRLWDSESTATSMPPPPWTTEDYRELGRIRGFFGDRIYGVFQWGSNALNLLDVEGARGFYWIRQARQVPYFEMAAPLRVLLHLWAGERDVELVHAAAVGRPDGCVLLVGPAGAGKSSAALACLGSDLGHLGDDYCLLEPGRPPSVLSVYSAAKSHQDTAERLPFLKGMVGNPVRPNYEKALYFLHEHMPEKLVRRAPLRAVVIPRVTGERGTFLRPASATAALGAVAPSTILQLPGTGQSTLMALKRAVTTVPCHHLDVGTDPEGVPAALGSLLVR